MTAEERAKRAEERAKEIYELRLKASPDYETWATKRKEWHTEYSKYVEKCKSMEIENEDWETYWHLSKSNMLDEWFKDMNSQPSSTL